MMATKEDFCDQALDFLGEGKLDEAITAYKEALALDPRYADALHGLAMAYGDNGMLDEAIETAKKLADLTPDDALVHTSLSIFFQRKGMIAEAEAESAKARMLDWKQQLKGPEKD